MSQITRCPQCQTRFKVVDDQLRISDGWVRCGKCKSVFDARTHLVQRHDEPADAPVVEPPKPAPMPAPAPVVQAPAPSLSVSPPAPVAAAVSAAVHEPAVPSPAAVAGAAHAPAPAESLAAVLVTGNSVAVDPHANVPELSVLVFPRRAGFGDSGYVDSSWMSAYDEAAAPEQAAPADAAPAKAGPSARQVADAQVAETDFSGLESEWQPGQDQRPEALRNSAADFSAHDDLAELQARESRLLDAIAEQKSRAETQALDSRSSSSESKSVLQPAPPPVVEKAAEGAAASQITASASGQSNAEKSSKAPASAAPEMSAAPAPDAVLHVAPEVAGRVVEPGKVEPSLAAPPNYVAEMDAAAAAAATAASTAGDEQPEPSFVRAAKRKAFWNQPSVVLASALCALLLLLGLLFQIAVTQRDQLAVQYPQARPLLEKVCQLAACEVAQPRELGNVSIDSTSFNPLGPRQFKLTVVLRNSADHAVAMPALDLSLNDAAEKLVLRRVLSTADMQAPAALPARGEWTAVLPIQVAEGSAVVGYRVVAFYP